MNNQSNNSFINMNSQPNNNYKSNKALNHKGFTLIELLVVLAIIGIIATVGIPVYQNNIKETKDTVARSTAISIHKYVDSRRVSRETTDIKELTLNHKIKIKGKPIPGVCFTVKSSGSNNNIIQKLTDEWCILIKAKSGCVTTGKAGTENIPLIKANQGLCVDSQGTITRGDGATDVECPSTKCDNKKGEHVI